MIRNLSLLVLLVSSAAYAGDYDLSKRRKKSDDHKIGLYLNGYHLLSGSTVFGGEYCFNGESSVLLWAGSTNVTFDVEDDPDSHFSGDSRTVYNNDVPGTGFTVSAAYRYYFDPSREGNDGWYFAPYMKYRQFSTEDNALIGHIDLFLNDGTQLGQFLGLSNSAFGAGISLGRAWQFGPGFTIDVFGGAGYKFINSTSFTNDFEPLPQNEEAYQFTDIDLRVGINIGYRFSI